MRLNEVGAAVNSPSHNDMSRSNYSKKYLKFAQNYEKIDISEQELAKMNKELRLSESDLDVEFEWLVPNSIAKNTLGMVFAKGGSGKSYGIFYLAHHLLVSKQVKRVIYLDGDQGARTLKKRGLIEMIKPNSRTFEYIRTNTAKFQDACGNVERYLERLSLANSKKTDNRPKRGYLNNALLIIDNIKDCLCVGKNINDAQEMSPIMALLKRIRDNQNMTVIFLHHSTKEGNDSSKREKDDNQNFVGSGVFHDAVDWSFSVTNTATLSTDLYLKFKIQKKRDATHNFAIKITPETKDMHLYYTDDDFKSVDRHIVNGVDVNDLRANNHKEQKPVVVEKQVESNPQEQTIEQAAEELQKELDQATDELDKENPTELEQKEKELKKAIADIFDEIL